MKPRNSVLLFLNLFFVCLIYLLTVGSTCVAAPSIKLLSLETAKVNASYLNLRQGPSTDFYITSVLKNGTDVQLCGEIGDWYIVYVPDKQIIGTVFKDFITTSTNSTVKNPLDINANIKPQPTNPPLKTMPPSNSNVSDNVKLTKDEIDLFDLINKERSSNNLQKLSLDPTISKISRLKSKDMLEKGYFSHHSPTYGSPFDMMRQFAITFKSAGENIAGNNSILEALNAWMASEGHRKNILDKDFNFTGIGITASPIYGKIIVQQFISK